MEVALVDEAAGFVDDDERVDDPWGGGREGVSWCQSGLEGCRCSHGDWSELGLEFQR